MRSVKRREKQINERLAKNEQQIELRTTATAAEMHGKHVKREKYMFRYPRAKATAHLLEFYLHRQH